LDRIPVAGPWITEKEVAYVTDAVRNAWYGNANVYHERFEKAFSEHLGVRYTLALPSCTSAIHLALLALGVGPADEVIVPETTWIATSAPISYVGATPVFADIDPRTWCLSADSFERRITPRTKAVIPVDLYGGIGDLDAIRAVAGRHGIVVIEDAAQAIGAQYHGRPAGSLGDVGVFSFHGSKTLTTGEGGLLATNREDLYRRALVLRDHGRKPGDTMFCNAEVAHKYKMSAMQAALGLAQLERLESLIARKREIFAWYVKHLAGLDGVALNHEPEGTRNAYWMVTVVWDEGRRMERRAVMERLAARGIATRPFFLPLSSLPAYAYLGQTEACRQSNAVSYSLSPRAINLPSALNLTEIQVRRVSEAFADFLDRVS
jgi:perosamine synthetase